MVAHAKNLPPAAAPRELAIDARALLSGYLETVPMSLALREAHRTLVTARQLTAIAAASGALPQVVLDAGCGDGSWWRAFAGLGLDVYGIDISDRELVLAKGRLTKSLNVDVSGKGAVAELRAAGFPAQFDLVIGNCSLEHVFDIESAIANLQKLLRPGGHLLLFVPTPTWALQGRLVAALKALSPRLAMTFSGAINGFFQHWHLFGDGVWRTLLAHHGFEVEETELLGNRKSEFYFRLGLPTAFVAFLFKVVFGHYPNRYLPRALASRLARYLIRTCRLDAQDGTSNDQNPQDPRYAYEYALRARKLG